MPPIFLVRAVFLLSATPPALPVRTVRHTQCSFSRPRLQLYRSGLSDRLSVPFFGHVSSFTGQNCQTQCAFSWPRLQLYRSGLSDRLSVPSLGHAPSFTGQDCQTLSVFLLPATPPALSVRNVRHNQCSFSRPRLQIYRSGLSDRLSVASLGHASSFTGQDCQTQCSFSGPRLQLYRSGLSDTLSVPSLGHASSFTGQDCQTHSVFLFFGHASSFTGQDCQKHSVLLLSATPPALPVRTIRNTQCYFSRSRLQARARTVFCCSFFPFSATPLVSPVRTVRFNVPFSRPRFQLDWLRQ